MTDSNHNNNKDLWQQVQIAVVSVMTCFAGKMLGFGIIGMIIAGMGWLLVLYKHINIGNKGYGEEVNGKSLGNLIVSAVIILFILSFSFQKNDKIIDDVTPIPIVQEPVQEVKKDLPPVQKLIEPIQQPAEVKTNYQKAVELKRDLDRKGRAEASLYLELNKKPMLFLPDSYVFSYSNMVSTVEYEYKSEKGTYTFGAKGYFTSEDAFGEVLKSEYLCMAYDLRSVEDIKAAMGCIVSFN